MGVSLLARAAREQGGVDRIVAALADALEETYRRDGQEVPLRADVEEQAAKTLVTNWFVVARPEQLAPEGAEWATWLVLAGRGWGKTRTGAEWIVGEIEAGRARRVALVAPTAADTRDVMIEGESGIMSLYLHRPEDERPKYEPSKRRVTWPNGAIATAYSGEDPDSLRGPQHDAFWADEIAAWKYPQATWDQLQFGLRLGARPRGVVTTTPRPIPLVRALIADETVVVTRGSTYDNADNLAPSFLAAIERAYEGTRLGRQEIHAEVLDDNPGALWKSANIEADRVLQLPVDLMRAGAGVDPSGSDNPAADEVGIITAGTAMCRCKGGEPELHAFVFGDASARYTPDGWAKATAKTYQENGLDRVIAEKNFGGDMVESNLKTLGDANMAVTAVTASRGKKVRAEPVAALYEQHKVHHVGILAKLEDELTQWNPNTDKKSPNRLDALVWILTWLMLGEQAPVFIPPRTHAPRRNPTPSNRYGR